MNKKFGFIGVGNMATAIVGGMLAGNFVDADKIYICDSNPEKCEALSNKGAIVCENIESVVFNSDIIVLAVKPQSYPQVLTQLSKVDCTGKIFVSIAAGISIEYVRSLLQQNVKVVRVMPNTPLLLSKGATAMCPSVDITEEEFEPVRQIFALSGVVEIIEESHMNEIISVNGSSPAYIYLFAKAIADYAEDCGIDRDKALNLICATFEGAAAMIKYSGDDIETLIKKVSSPGGTTIAALNSFEENNFVGIIKTAAKACTDRAEELGK